MTIAYRFKVYQLNGSKKKKLSALMSVAANVYNHALALKRRYWRLYHKNLPIGKMQAHIAKMKHRCYSRWGKLNAQTTQQIVERIYNGYIQFLSKTAKHSPKFRNWKKYRSITFKQNGYTLNGNVFTINKLRLRLGFHKSREIEGKIQAVTLKRDAVGEWWLSFIVRKEGEVHNGSEPTMGRTAGFDFGLRHFLIRDDGAVIESPQYLRESMNDVRRKSKNLSKKKQGSHNYERARVEKARLSRKIANNRSDFHWRLANELVKEYDVICLETLNLKAMQMRWGRKISDLGFGNFVQILSHVCAKHGKQLVFVDRWEPTTKRCSSCGHVMDEMPLKVREWTCPKCGAHHDRDVNAAVNIKMVGTSTIARGAVRQTLVSAAPMTAESHTLKGWEYVK